MKFVGPNQLEYMAAHFNLVVQWDSTFQYSHNDKQRHEFEV
jgi:hypothetical protein